MLHLLSENSLSQAIADRIAAKDVLVLLGNSIWAAYSGHADNGKLTALLSRGCQVTVMADALTASGIELPKLLTGVDVIDYPALVELSVAHHPIHTWC